jgi:hypothetical protein
MKAGCGEDQKRGEKDMEGRYSKGILVILASCKDASQEDALREWYKAIYMPDMVATGWVENGLLYRNIKPSLDEGEARYLAIHETDRWDMEDMLDEISMAHAPRWREQGRDNTNLQVERIGVFRKCGPPSRPEVSGFTTQRTGIARTAGLLLALAKCTEPRREGDFNNWFNRVYVPEVMAAGPFHTAYRYAKVAQESDKRRLFVALYESDTSDLAGDIERFLSHWQASAKRSPYIEDLGHDLFAPI